MSRLWILGLLALFVSPPALARDGVLEINQTCAVHTGCFSGDSPGFPVRVSKAASYRLSSSLDATGSSAAAVEITADGARLDLNGFAVIGGDVRDYVEGNPEPGRATKVHNGFVRDASILLISSDSRVEEITLLTDTAQQIRVGMNSRVHRSIVVCSGSSCTGAGILAWPGTAVSENVVRGYAVGIECGALSEMPEGCVISRNLVSDVLAGIDANEGGAIVNNVLRATQGHQLEGYGLMVEGNDIGGRFALSSSQLLGNVVHGASTPAFACQNVLYQANTFVENNGGNDNPQFLLGNCISFQTNVCGWDGGCP